MAAKRLQTLVNVLVANATVLTGFLLLLEVGSCAAIRMKAVISPGDTSPRPPRFQQRAYADHQDWIYLHLANERRFKFRYRVSLWGPPDYRSLTLNVSGGRRLSKGELTRSPRAERVFVFGGSTVWGAGVRDDYTIPSYLNELDGSPDRVFVNYGRAGFQTTQELLALSLVLSRGDVPDAAIFYDGANDIYTSIDEGPGNELSYGRHVEMIEGGPGLLRTLYSSTQLSQVVTWTARWLRRVRERTDTPYALTDADREVVAQAADIYLANLRYLHRLGNQFGFEVDAFLQPYLLAGYEIEAGVVTDFEREIYEVQPQRDRALIRRFYERVRASGEVIDLSQVFLEWGEPGSYVDPVHIGPSGNEQIAKRILAVLEAGGS